MSIEEAGGIIIIIVVDVGCVGVSRVFVFLAMARNNRLLNGIRINHLLMCCDGNRRLNRCVYSRIVSLNFCVGESK